MEHEFRTVRRDEIRQFVQRGVNAFGEDLPTDDALLEERVLANLPLDRTYAAFEGDTIVASGADFELQITVPGGPLVPLSGLTEVSVLPTHRQRGFLRALMHRHFDMARRRGEPLGGLWASQAGIYGRFGYGAASDRVEVEFDARLVGMPPVDRTVAIQNMDIAGPALAEVIAPIWDNALAERPGMVRRTAAWWEHHLFYDPPAWREGATALRCAVADEGGPAGYVLYRNRQNWVGSASHGSTKIVELVATSSRVRRALWRHLAANDLFPIVSYWDLPVDDSLRWEVSEPRHLRQVGPIDALWVRLISVPEALMARRYAVDDRIVLSVADPMCPWNQEVFELAIDGGVAECRPSDRDAELTLGVAELGALYLGGQSALSLASAGRIAGSPQTIERLDAMFRWPVAPWCAEIF